MADDDVTASVAEEVAETIRELRTKYGDKVPPEFGALAAGAMVLAKALDAGAGLSTAAIQRELRTTITAMTPKGERPSDELRKIMEGIAEATKQARGDS